MTQGEMTAILIFFKQTKALLYGNELPKISISTPTIGPRRLLIETRLLMETGFLVIMVLFEPSSHENSIFRTHNTRKYHLYVENENSIICSLTP